MFFKSHSKKIMEDHLSEIIDRESIINSEKKQTMVMRRKTDSMLNELSSVIKNKKYIIIYEDDSVYRRLLCEHFKNFGYDYVISTGNALEFSELLGALNGDVAAIVIDLRNPVIKGSDILEKFKKKEAKKFIVTGMPEFSDDYQKAKRNCDFIFNKDEDIERIVNRIDKFIREKE